MVLLCPTYNIRKILSKGLVCIMALLIFNYSVDFSEPISAPKHNNTNKSATLYNEIETVYELVAECWMNLDDCVPENGEDSNDDKNCNKFKPKELYDSPLLYHKPAFQYQRLNILISSDKDFVITAYNKITTPPPDVA